MHIPMIGAIFFFFMQFSAYVDQIIGWQPPPPPLPFGLAPPLANPWFSKATSMKCFWEFRFFSEKEKFSIVFRRKLKQV